MQQNHIRDVHFAKWYLGFIWRWRGVKWMFHKILPPPSSGWTQQVCQNLVHFCNTTRHHIADGIRLWMLWYIFTSKMSSLPVLHLTCIWDTIRATVARSAKRLGHRLKSRGTVAGLPTGSSPVWGQLRHKFKEYQRGFFFFYVYWTVHHLDNWRLKSN